MSARGGGDESFDASVRSDAKLFGSEAKSSYNEKLNKANKGRITEVEENDLELEGGMSSEVAFDVAKSIYIYERNKIIDPLKVKSSAHFAVTQKKVTEAFDIMNILKGNIDSKNFINEFLTQEQLIMLGQNKRNMVTFVGKQ